MEPGSSATSFTCTRCGYPLTSATGSESCPECGQSVERSRREWRQVGGNRECFARLAGHLVLAAPIAGTLAVAWAVQSLLVHDLLGTSTLLLAPDGTWTAPIGASIRSGVFALLLLLNLITVVLWRSVVCRPPMPKLPLSRARLRWHAVGWVLWSATALFACAALMGSLLPAFPSSNWWLTAWPFTAFAFLPFPTAIAVLCLRAPRSLPAMRRATFASTALAALLLAGITLLVGLLISSSAHAAVLSLLPAEAQEMVHAIVSFVTNALWVYGVAVMLALVSLACFRLLRRSVQEAGLRPLPAGFKRRTWLLASVIIVVHWFGTLAAHAGVQNAFGRPRSLDLSLIGSLLTGVTKDGGSVLQSIGIPLIVPLAWIFLRRLAARIAYSPMSSAQRSGFSR